MHWNPIWVNNPDFIVGPAGTSYAHSVALWIMDFHTAAAMICTIVSFAPFVLVGYVLRRRLGEDVAMMFFFCGSVSAAGYGPGYLD